MHFLLILSQCLVAFVKRGVWAIVYWIVRFDSKLPFGRILAADDGLLLGAKHKVLVFDDAGEGDFAFVVVDHGDALIVLDRENLRFKTDAAIVERPVDVVEVGVDGAREDHLVRDGFEFGLLFEEVGIKAHFNAVEHLLDHSGVAVLGDALESVSEVVVVESEAHRQASDDRRGKIAAVAPPLLFGVSLDEDAVDVFAHEADGLFLEVGGFNNAGGLALLINLRSSFGRRLDSPHLIEGVHVEGQVVELALVVGDGRVDEIIKSRELTNVLPNFFVAGVEDVGAILVNLNAFNFFGEDVAADVAALFDNETTLAALGSFVGKHGAEKTGADDEVVIMVRHLDLARR